MNTDDQGRFICVPLWFGCVFRLAQDRARFIFVTESRSRLIKFAQSARCWLGRGLAAAGLLFLIISFTPLTAWWARALARPWEDPRGEVLIVLGSDRVDDMIGYSSYWRSVYAVWAYREGGFRRVVVSGGPGGAAVAESMRDLLVTSGVPSQAILLETESTSTRENAVRTVELLRGETGRSVLLTSDFHMYRAYRCFRRAGLDVVAFPVPDALKRSTRWYRRWTAFVDLVAESGKIAYYWAQGWL
jgi:uncharacterized SAM-binding protein YcdF (DUF218 family)